MHVAEARDRVGGRVWTWRDAGLAPFHAEAGGDFIDAEHEATLQLIDELGLERIRVLPDGFGLALEHAGRLRVVKTQRDVWQSLNRALAPALRGFQIAGHDWNTAAASELAKYSVSELLSAAHASPRLHALTMALRGFFLADPSGLSALVIVELLAGGADPGRQKMFRVKGGNDRLPQELARRTRAIVELEHSVWAIRQGASGVRIAIENRKVRDWLEADYAIITVPVPVLRTWEFDPPLPAAQREAFERISQGEATKIVMRFGERWWRRRGRPNAFGTNLPIGAIWESADEQRGAAILTLLAGASCSVETKAIMAQQGINAIVQRLEWLGTPRESPLSARVISWEDEPWSRGGYAVFAPGFDGASRSWLSRTYGRVLFAGEHTSVRWQGYMNGAVESGLRVVTELEALEQVRRLTGRASSAPHT